MLSILNWVGKMFPTHRDVPISSHFLLISQLSQALWMYCFYRLKVEWHIHKWKEVIAFHWNIFVMHTLSTLFWAVTLILTLTKALLIYPIQAALVSLKHCTATKNAEQVKKSMKGANRLSPCQEYESSIVREFKEVKAKSINKGP